METNPSTARSTKRRAELAAIAQEFTFDGWSGMLTAIKKREAVVLSTEQHAEMIALIKEMYDWTRYKDTDWAKRAAKIIYPPAPAGTTKGVQQC